MWYRKKSGSAKSSVAVCFVWFFLSLAIVKDDDFVYAEHCTSSSHLPGQCGLLIVGECTVSISEIPVT